MPGRRQSVTWFPMHGIIIGAAGSMPISGGFNLMQATLMFIMLIGIGKSSDRTERRPGLGSKHC
ncbi:MAG: hypothetical protein NVS2B4_20430 [Ramlibacter sp.]